MFKKAMMGGVGGGPRKPISLILGIVFLALGIVPLVHPFGLSLPVAPEGIVLWIVATVGGLILLWDAMSMGMGMGLAQQIRMPSIVGGLVLLAVGLIPLLNGMGVIGFGLPAFAEIVIQILFAVDGLLLLFGGMQSGF
jgi:hypothetical protein